MTESERLTLLLSQRVDLLVKRGNATSQSGAIRFNTHLTQQWVRCGRTETRTETICSKSERQRRELCRRFYRFQTGKFRKLIRWKNQCLALRRSEGNFMQTITLNKKLLKALKTPNGGIKQCQLEALGLTWPPRQWMERIEGKTISLHAYKTALAMAGNEHSESLDVAALVREIPRESASKVYGAKLKDPRWQRKRLEIFQRDGFACVKCKADHLTLSVHHEKYESDPWDTPNEFLYTVCNACHRKEHGI